MKNLDNVVMAHTGIERTLHVTMAGKNRRRVERRLAESLAAATNLAKGDALVMWLGTGHEATNLEALATWVSNTLKQLNLDANRQAIPHLLAELERTLWAWEDQAWQ
ncbi:hypothetical protein [Vreelandella arcis]|uniref:Uncharacterized protein n=1 Tax=Vreelandella arcis TaxID=416873 RepID=A0A1G9XL39_9GAMM|nr:hypothetical protein [Halomonas arcis]SDM97470.1 hypothetical protein SAMN04487951_101325 [Halomonas arcis]